MVKDIESTAWQAAALKSARISTRDYVLTMIVVGRAEMTIEMTAKGTLDGSNAARDDAKHRVRESASGGDHRRSRTAPDKLHRSPFAGCPVLDSHAGQEIPGADRQTQKRPQRRQLMRPHIAGIRTISTSLSRKSATGCPGWPAPVVVLGLAPSPAH